VVNPLGVGTVERPVLGLEVGERESASRTQERPDRTEGGGGVGQMVEHEERHGEVERRLRRRVGEQVELDRGDRSVPVNRELLAGDLEHPRRRVGQHELADVPRQRQAEQPGPRPHLDRAHLAGQRDDGADRVGDGFRSSSAFRRVPGPCALVERAHLRIIARAPQPCATLSHGRSTWATGCPGSLPDWSPRRTAMDKKAKTPKKPKQNKGGTSPKK